MLGNKCVVSFVNPFRFPHSLLFPGSTWEPLGTYNHLILKMCFRSCDLISFWRLSLRDMLPVGCYVLMNFRSVFIVFCGIFSQDLIKKVKVFGDSVCSDINSI